MRRSRWVLNLQSRFTYSYSRVKISNKNRCPLRQIEEGITNERRREEGMISLASRWVTRYCVEDPAVPRDCRRVYILRVNTLYAGQLSYR